MTEYVPSASLQVKIHVLIIFPPVDLSRAMGNALKDWEKDNAGMDTMNQDRYIDRRNNMMCSGRVRIGSMQHFYRNPSSQPGGESNVTVERMHGFSCFVGATTFRCLFPGGDQRTVSMHVSLMLPRYRLCRVLSHRPCSRVQYQYSV